jgi:hypothetical protein
VKGKECDASLTFDIVSGQSSDAFEIISTQEDGIAFRGDCAHAGAQSPNYQELKEFLEPLANTLTNGRRDRKSNVLKKLGKKPSLAEDCRFFLDTWPKGVDQYHHGQSCDQIYTAWPYSKKPKKS